MVGSFSKPVKLIRRKMVWYNFLSLGCHHHHKKTHQTHHMHRKPSDMPDVGKYRRLSKPVKLIGRKMVLKRLSAHGVFWMMCISSSMMCVLWCAIQLLQWKLTKLLLLRDTRPYCLSIHQLSAHGHHQTLQ